MNKLIIIFICIIFFTKVYANDNTETLNNLTNLLNTKISGASRFEQNLHEINGFSNVVDTQNIWRFGLRNTAKVLQTFAGNYLSYEKDYQYMGVKGISRPGDFNSRILLLSDGLRLNDPLYDSALLGNESQIDIDWIKRIEFVSSPGSAQFGSNAILGVANLVSFTGADIKGSRVRYARESYQGNKLTLLHGNELGNGDDYIFGLTVYENNGSDIYLRQFDQIENNRGVAHAADAERYIKGFFKFSLDNWLIQGVASSRFKVLPTAYWGSLFNTSKTTDTDSAYLFNITHQVSLSENTERFVRVRTGGYQYLGKFDHIQSDYPNHSQSAWYGFGYEIKSHQKHHQIALGAEIQYNQRLSQTQYSPIAGNTARDQVNTDYFNYSFYAEDNWKINSWNSLQTGFRFDHINLRNAASPKIAISHKLNETSSIKFIFSRAFRAPNSYELLNTPDNLGRSQINNDGLKNEYIDSSEIIVQQITSPNHLFTLNIFNRSIDRLIQQQRDFAGYYIFINGEKTISNGLSIESNYIDDRLNLRSNLTMQNSTQNDSTLSNSPKFLAKILASYYFPAINLDMSLNTQFNAKAKYDSNDYVAAYNVSNLIFSLRDNFSYGKASLGIYNIFDKKFYSPASTYVRDSYLIQNERQFRLSWEYIF